MLSAEAVADVDAEMKCGRDCTIWAAPLSFSTISPLVQSASPLFILPAFAHQSAAEHLKHAAAAITTTPTRMLLHRKHAVLRVLPCSIGVPSSRSGNWDPGHQALFMRVILKRGSKT
jgi:hypothetical protein